MSWTKKVTEMTDHRIPGTGRIAKSSDGRYKVYLPSRDITVVTEDIRRARTLDNAESVILAGRRKYPSHGKPLHPADR